MFILRQIVLDFQFRVYFIGDYFRADMIALALFFQKKCLRWLHAEQKACIQNWYHL